jgi:hypothetical protein
VSPLKAKTALHQADDLVKVAITLVERQKGGKLFSMDLYVSSIARATGYYGPSN